MFHKRVPSGKIPRWYAKVGAYGTRNWALPFLLLAGGCMMWSNARMSTRPWTILYIMVMRAFARRSARGSQPRVFRMAETLLVRPYSPGMCSGRTGVVPSLACLRLGRCGGPKPHRSIQGLGVWGIRMCASSLQLSPCVGCAGGRLEFHWPSWPRWPRWVSLEGYTKVFCSVSFSKCVSMYMYHVGRLHWRFVAVADSSSSSRFVAVGISVDGNSQSSTAVPILEGHQDHITL